MPSLNDSKTFAKKKRNDEIENGKETVHNRNHLTSLTKPLTR